MAKLSSVLRQRVHSSESSIAAKEGGAIFREGIPSGMLHILRIFGIRIPNVLGNSTQGYLKVGKSDFL